MVFLRFLALMAFFLLVSAINHIPDKQMNEWLNAGGIPLAVAAQPMWFFGQSRNQPPCYPTWAIRAGKQAPGGGLCAFPEVGCHCRNPGVKIGNPGPKFPIYYTYNKCNDNEIRVAYNIFFDKDGFIAGGHRYDWEHVIVVWARGSDSKWHQSRLFLSQHKTHDKKNWNDIQNTFKVDEANKPRGGDNGKKGFAHPKVYVAWAKHAIYHDRNTGWNDPLSQQLGHAFRSQDWWYYHSKGDYIRADRSTEVGRQIAGLNWGDATSTPPNVHDGLCSI
ncbi:hypothetical protein FSHL1_006920 [Fusarium sambucinum]